MTSGTWPVTMVGMTSSLAVLVIDALDPAAVADFWCRVLGWEVVERADDGFSIGSRDRSGPSIDIFAVPEPKSTKNRLHLDLRAKDCTRDEELQRLLDLGAVPVDVGQADDASWTVLADPEGNEFCLLDATVEEVRADVVELPA